MRGDPILLTAFVSIAMYLAPVLSAIWLFAFPRLAIKQADTFYEGEVVAEATTSAREYLDAPKLSTTTANETTYDWYLCLHQTQCIFTHANRWYFDAV